MSAISPALDYDRETRGFHPAFLNLETNGMGEDSDYIEKQGRRSLWHFVFPVTTISSLPEHIFATNKAKWTEETMFCSSIDRLVSHPSYLAIIAQGKKILPFILNDLKQEPKPWFRIYPEQRRLHHYQQPRGGQLRQNTR